MIIGDRVINTRDLNKFNPGYYPHIPSGSVGEIIYKNKIVPKMYKVRFKNYGLYTDVIVYEFDLCLV